MRDPGGLGIAVLSACSFGLSGPIATGLMNAGWSAGAAVTARVVVAALVLTPATIGALRGRLHLLRANATLILLYGAIAVAGCQLAYFQAVRRVPIGVALLIEYLAPIVVLAWVWARHQQRPTRLTLTGAAVAVIGLVLVLDLTGPRLDPLGLAFCAFSTFGAAFYFMASADDTTGLPPLALAGSGLMVGAVGLVLAGLLGLVPWNTTTAASTYDGFTLPWWAAVLGLGLVTGALAYVAGIAAARRLGPRLASFIAMLEVVAAVLAAWLALGQSPTVMQAIGGAVLLAGVATVRLGEA